MHILKSVSDVTLYRAQRNAETSEPLTQSEPTNQIKIRLNLANDLTRQVLAV